jgi:hypothetical protein
LLTGKVIESDVLLNMNRAKKSPKPRDPNKNITDEMINQKRGRIFCCDVFSCNIIYSINMINIPHHNNNTTRVKSVAVEAVVCGSKVRNCGCKYGVLRMAKLQKTAIPTKKRGMSTPQ